MLNAIESNLASEPVAPALIDGHRDRIVTREGLDQRARAIADLLRREGLSRGDFLAVQLPNSVDFVATFLATLRLGLTMAPIDRDARESEVAAVLHHFSARALVYRPQREGELPQVSPRHVRSIPIEGGPVPLVKLSSGSTGTPKGVLTSDVNLLADATSICRTMQIRPDDRNLGAIPFSHSYGFSNLVTPLLLQGTAVVISNDYLPLSILELCNRFECTVVPGIPMMFDHLSQLPRSDGGFRTVRTFISAGAPLTASVSGRFRDRFEIDVHNFYGCSECGGIAYDRAGASVERGIAGTPMEGVSVEIGAEGRLIVASAAVARGYLGGGTAEVSRFRSGTFATDDLARLHPSGEIELVGRIGEIINTAGKKVNPREVELVILQIEGVREVKVYGAAAGARGDVVAAAVVADPDVTREAIRSHCRTHLSSHKVPRIVKLIERIPLDERGKVKRSALELL